MGPGCCCGCSGSGTAPDRSYAGTRMGEALDKLYRVKYAKSGRASCKKCSESLAKDPLQMAVIVQIFKQKPKGIRGLIFLAPENQPYLIRFTLPEKQTGGYQASLASQPPRGVPQGCSLRCS
ncbi:uncharacterized protein [Manis javanica]|uniref:uncharacterized protein isoform X1 n=1 Tax=Manis javanica TaxID=9974 RepID=UPI003C6D84E3